MQQYYLAEFARDKIKINIKMQQSGRGIKKTELYETMVHGKMHQNTHYIFLFHKYNTKYNTNIITTPNRNPS